MVVATSAFGLGIDLSDIRVVVHMDVPRRMEVSKWPLLSELGPQPCHSVYSHLPYL